MSIDLNLWLEVEFVQQMEKVVWSVKKYKNTQNKTNLFDINYKTYKNTIINGKIQF